MAASGEKAVEEVSEKIENLDVKEDVGGASKKKKKKKSKKQQEEAARNAFKAPVDPNLAVEKMKESLGKQFEEKIGKSHNFWDTQPVPKLDAAVSPTDNGPIDPVKTQADIQQTPYSLGDNYTWDEIDIDDEEQALEVYNLLNINYVEDDDNMFRFDYSIDFLRWALKPPGYLKLWHVGIRKVKNRELVGFITAIPATVRVYEKKIRLVEINFLCVKKRLRKHHMAPHLIREITRRVNCQNIFQAVYTAGVVLPRPIASCRYYHRSLNPIKLIAIRFSPPPKGRFSNAAIQKRFRLPKDPSTPGIRPMEKKDVSKACALLAEHLKQFHIAASFDEQEFAHWFLPREGVIESYVVENPSTKKITDMISFYALPSTIIGHDKYNTLNAAYSFYNVNTSTTLLQLTEDALILARNVCITVSHRHSFSLLYHVVNYCFRSYLSKG